MSYRLVHLNSRLTNNRRSGAPKFLAGPTSVWARPTQAATLPAFSRCSRAGFSHVQLLVAARALREIDQSGPLPHQNRSGSDRSNTHESMVDRQSGPLTHQNRER